MHNEGRGPDGMVSGDCVMISFNYEWRSEIGPHV
jgi:hypothetical protein